MARLTAVAAVFGVFVALVESQASSLKPPWPVALALTAAIALVGAVTQRIYAAFRREGTLEGLVLHWRPQRLADTSPHDLGVFGDTADQPYIPREIDDQVVAAMTHNNLILLHGPRASGKSRTAAEFARRLFGDRRVLIPQRGEDLAPLLDVHPNPLTGLAQTVLWLDGLDRFLGALTPEVVDELQERCKVVATISDETYDDISSAGGEPAYAAQRFWSRAQAVAVGAELQGAEQTAALELYPGMNLTKPFTANLPQRPASGSPEPLLPVIAPSRWLGYATRVLFRTWRRDRTLKGLTGLLALTALALGVGVLTQGYTQKRQSLGSQLQDVKDAESERGRRVMKTEIADLRGTGEKSYFLVFRDRASELTGGTAAPRRSRSRSDEVRILDIEDKKLVERFRFEPSGRRYRFGWRAGADLDGDGAKEVVGGWAREGGADVPATGVTRPMPVAFSRAERGEGYRQTGLLLAPDKLQPPLRAPVGDAATRVSASYADEITLVDTKQRRNRVSGYSAEEVAVAKAGPDARLVAAYLASAEGAGSPKEIEVRAWPLTLETGAPKLGRSCVVLDGPRRDHEKRIVIAPSRFVTVDRFIAAQWTQLQSHAAC